MQEKIGAVVEGEEGDQVKIAVIETEIGRNQRSLCLRPPHPRVQNQKSGKRP